jgi:hypothetical protein
MNTLKRMDTHPDKGKTGETVTGITLIIVRSETGKNRDCAVADGQKYSDTQLTNEESDTSLSYEFLILVVSTFTCD